MKPLTILKIYFTFFLVSCFILTLIDWQLIICKNISNTLFIMRLFLAGFGGLLLDWILVKLIKNKKISHGLELLIIVVFTIVIWNEL